ncbi:MAG: hypothetical protein EPN88_14310 [Bacteroidetes bacterium]|nr:MAG: hypothetical protein EPN88_14310 [Bacteroidota bacterium]
MYQKDYILRMIEMFGELIAGILGLIKRGEFIQASDQISRIYYDMLKEDASFFRTIPEEELTRTLLQEHNYTMGHLEILAELFNTEAELCMAQGNKSGYLEYSGKSLILFEFIDSEQKIYSLERVNKMETIRKKIDEMKES